MTGIGLLLGKPVRRSPVLGEVVARLRGRGHRVEVAVPTADAPLPGWLTEVAVVALRGLDAELLRRLARHEATEERAGVAFCDPPSALLRLRDRATLGADLTAGGVPHPRQTTVASWAEVAGAAASWTPVVVKRVDGSVGRGAGVWHGPLAALPRDAPFPGPYVVQEAVGDGGLELKVYRYGVSVRAVAMTAPGRAGCEVTVDATLRELTERVARVTGLTMLGVDVLGAPAAPVVVDVNPFPSGRRLSGAEGGPGRSGLRGAAGEVAGHLERVARRGASPTAVAGGGGVRR